MQVQTSCKGCLFAEYTKDTQTGCKLNRAKKLNPKNDLLLDGEKQHYTFNRFCNTYRPEEWRIILSDEEREDMVATVMKEVSPRVGFFIFLDNEDGVLDRVREILNDIREQTFGCARYIALINSRVEYNEQLHDILRENFDFEQTEFHIVQTLVEDKNAFLLDEAFRHAKNGWAYVTSTGENVRRDLLQKVHDRINIDMKRLVLVKPYEELNGMIFQTAIYKFLDGNRRLQHKDTGEDMTLTFLEKAEAMNTSDPDTIVTWEEFINESA
tara:strand:+ start:6396 stop:7202 length:807 start_codon:yes stop_codon:yes gene_type:complete